MKLHFYALIVTSKLFFANKRLMNDFEVSLFMFEILLRMAQKQSRFEIDVKD